MCFGGFIPLMNHRKRTHPSTKICKNYSSGNCPFNSECWYVHEDNSNNIEQMKDIFNCTFCDDQISGRHNFMKHKKDHHTNMTPNCTNFLEGKCIRSSEACWFIHSKTTSTEQDFQKAHTNPYPPDHMQQIVEMLNQVHIKVDNLQKSIVQKKV